MTEAESEEFNASHVPEALRYIDEKEALDHHIFIPDDSERYEQSPGIDPETLSHLTAGHLENQTNFPPIFTKSRFTCPIPDHFYCEICQNIVKDPRECISCENLLCKECIDSVDACPFGCDTYKFKHMAKFAFKMYQDLTLDCKNKPFGCSYTGTIKNIDIHEENCQFVVTQCENSLCDRIVLKKDKTKEGASPLLCSEICENLIKFSVLIDEENREETLKHFKGLNERCKKLIEYEVRLELEFQYKRIEESRRENELYKKMKEKLEKEIFAWQNAYHPGKWNLRTNKWTCCGTNEITGIGCKHIS